MWKTVLTIGNLVLLLSQWPSSAATSAEITVFATLPLRPVFNEIVPEYTRISGHKIAFGYSNSTTVRDRVMKGEVADMVITMSSLIEELHRAGKILSDGRIEFAKVGIGIQVRKGAPKPDISSVDAFLKTLLSAKSIGYGDGARGNVSGAYIANMIERLKISDELKPKTRLVRGITALAVAAGEVELGIAQISEIVAQPGIEFVGPLPAELQNYTVFAPGVVASSQHSEIANDLIKFIAARATSPLLKEKGLEPVLNSR